MKSFLYLILLIILFSGCYPVERNCTKFHKGTFIFEQIVGDQLLTSTFLRNDSLEIEYFDNKIDSASIRWINSCECVLTKINPVSNQDKRPIAIKILRTQGNEYTFEYALVGSYVNKQRGQITKISDELKTP